MNKEDHWFLHLRWHRICIECQNKKWDIDYCKECAQSGYDEWGHYLPAYLICYDHDDTPEYLENKRKEMQHSCYRIENIVNERVLHRQYGIGIVTKQTEAVVTVHFPAIGAERQFLYPNALCTYLRLIDSSVQ